MASVCAVAQQPAQVFHGTWIATVGKGKVLHGTWTGGTLPDHPNVGEGAWAITSAGQIVLEWTWHAEKSARTWEGVWSGRTATGESLAGSWGADLEHWSGKTFHDLLERTFVEQVSGWWQSGQAEGHWWLRGTERPAR